ncbi:MAG: hypothetical protein IJ410_05015 [Oscillospiraceae bacterium]|nr:hypothetical protein [Oscillospiraceae bacterium]
MKKIIALICTAVVLVLVAVNRGAMTEQEQLAQSRQLAVLKGDTEQVYLYSEEDENFISFDTQMKRRNGDVFDKNYTGIQLQYILQELDVAVTDDLQVSAVCADNYEITLTGSEIAADGNVWLVTQENSLPLENGTFMLVVNNDEFSTRWAQNVVQIKINEKQN